MKIINLKVMRGPNYFSINRKKLIVMDLDIGELEHRPTNKLPGFADRLEKLIPSLFKHRCSTDHPGGFFERVREGTWMGHVVEHIALELQTMAGMVCEFGKTYTTINKGIYTVVFSYEIENAGKYAARAAIDIAEALVKNEEYDIEEDVRNLIVIKQEEGFGPSTQSIIDEAVKKNIPFRRADDQSYVIFGYGKNQRSIKASMTGCTSNIAVELAADKEDTKKILAKEFIPIPEGVVIKRPEALAKAIETIGFPLVIKPINGNHGRGVTTNIRDKESAEAAFALAKDISNRVIIEKFMQGPDYRFLVINYKLVAVGNRVPASVSGDGKSTIKELVEKTNTDPQRGDFHEKVLTKIKIDESTIATLARKGLTENSVIAIGETVYLKDTANMSTGGTCIDKTDEVHPFNRFLAERIARVLNLDICGIDIIAKDISIPFSNENGAVLEVNAAPGFRMHLSPSKGKPRNVAEPVIEMLYPNHSQSRIPIIAVTGTNGKTTTVRLMAHMAKESGYKVGFTTTDGIYLDGNPIYYGDCSGPQSAITVLGDPLIDFAVLECARGGILRNGLAFDHCDVSVITNISEDHLGLMGINSIEELAKVKGVLARSTTKNGYAVLNADDDLVFAIKNEIECNLVLFSTHSSNERIQRHSAKGGLCVTIENETLLIVRGERKMQIAKIIDIPLAMGGKAPAMIKNILAATAAAAAFGIEINNIRKGLVSFIPSPEFTPGRMNIFEFRNFKIMVDYAHNAGGYEELKAFLKELNASYKVGIVAAPGDRRDQDIRGLGHFAAQMFDEVVIRHDTDGRGRTNENLTDLITQGIMEVDPRKKITVISEERDALRYAIDNAKKDSFIVVCTDKVMQCIEFIRHEQKVDQEKVSQAA